MTHTVNSFDVFDTLIARRSIHPHAVFHRLEAHVGQPGLAAARIAADERLWHTGPAYQLEEIWREVGSAMQLDANLVSRSMALEIDFEHDEIIPIAQNLALVKDGDILISDTYLPSQVVLSLLRKAGLQRTVTLVTSNHGKFRGTIWRQLLEHVAIREHLGDNLHSDGKTPFEAGIRAVIFPGAQAPQWNNNLRIKAGSGLPCSSAKSDLPIPSPLLSWHSATCGTRPAKSTSRS